MSSISSRVQRDNPVEQLLDLSYAIAQLFHRAGQGFGTHGMPDEDACDRATEKVMDALLKAFEVTMDQMKELGKAAWFDIGQPLPERKVR